MGCEAVSGFVSGVRGMARAREGLVFKFVAGGGDIMGHGDVDVFVVAYIISVDREAQVF